LEDGWSYRLNTLAGTVYCTKLLGKGLLFPNPNDPEVTALSRTGNPRELLYGPLVFGGVLCYVGHRAFVERDLTTYLMSSLGFGDGLAPIAAKMLGSWGKYRSVVDGEAKSVAGSVGMFFGTILGFLVLSRVLGAPETVESGRLVGVALAATAAEAVSGTHDNLLIVLVVLTLLPGVDQSGDAMTS
jgi:dolichol kinase